MLKKILSIDTNHLSKHKFTYFFHLKRALDVGIRLVLGGICGIIHAFIPMLFTETATIAVKYTIEKHENFPTTDELS